jgi:hypothetical protein
MRPVSARPGRSVSEYERQYQDGKDPRLLDIVDIPVIRASPVVGQPENWLLDPDWYWEFVGRRTKMIDALADDPAELWLNGNSTVAGENDRVPESLLGPGGASLYLVHAEQLTIRVLAPGAAFGNAKRKVRGSFTYRGIRTT